MDEVLAKAKARVSICLERKLNALSWVERVDKDPKKKREKSLASSGLKKAEDAYERALAKLKEYEQAAGDTEAVDLLVAGGATADAQDAPSQATNVGGNDTQPTELEKRAEGQASVPPAKGANEAQPAEPAKTTDSLSSENVTVQVECETGRMHTSPQATNEGTNKAQPAELGETMEGQLSVPLAADEEENGTAKSKLELLTEASERELMAGVQDVRHETGKRKCLDGETSSVKARKGDSVRTAAKKPKKEKEASVAEDKVMEQVREVLRHPILNKLSPSVRTAIWTQQSMAPEAATTSCSFVLDHILSNSVNSLCAYHSDVDKHGLDYDGSPDARFILNGVPKKRLVARTLAERKVDPVYRERLAEGYLHCGCKTDHALLDFYFWKTLALTGTVNGKEVIEQVPRWTPREHAFIVMIFEQYSFLTVDDLYTKGLSLELHKEKMLQTQLERILEGYNELRESRGLKKKALVEVDESDEVDDKSSEWSGLS